MILRNCISGTYDRAALRKLLGPIAWQGTTTVETRHEEEEAIRQLVSEAEEALDACVDAYAVEIKGGKVISIMTVGAV